MKTCSSGIDRHCGLHVGRISFPSVLSPVVGPFFPWPTLLCFNDRSQLGIKYAPTYSCTFRNPYLLPEANSTVCWNISYIYIYIHVHDIIIYIHVYIMLSHAITIHISTNHLNLQHQLYIYYINLHTVMLKIGRSNHKSTHKLP